MKKPVKISLIIFGVLAALLLGGYAFMYWSTHSAGDIHWKSDVIPAPVKVLPPLRLDGQGWPAWQGPMGNDHSPITHMVKDWSKGLKKVWEVQYLCRGPKSMSYSCPAIQGNRLVVPGRDGENDLLFCLDPETGKLLWMRSFALASDDKYGQGPRATPTIDGDKVYTFSREGDVRCHALFDGALLWEASITNAGCTPPEWGSSGSPLVLGDRLILHAGGSSLALAYDKKSGALLWKSAPGKGCYTTPVPMTIGGLETVVLFHQKAISFLDPATGAPRWELPLGPFATDMTVTTPSLGDGRIFFSTLKSGGSTAVETKSGRPEILWQSNLIQCYQGNPILLDGYVYSYSGMYFLNPKGSFKCVSMADGRLQWETSRVGIGTMIYADGHFVCLDVDGNLFLVKPDAKAFRLVTEFRGAIPEVKTRAWTKPVIADGKLFLRHGNRLICYRLTK